MEAKETEIRDCVRCAGHARQNFLDVFSVHASRIGGYLVTGSKASVCFGGSGSHEV